ncbi:response regulator [Agrobacterium vitis]|uniref:Response regulator n=1 Tax=Agrobacterium vitis TaxID=373 RepID=A0A109CYT1_AGRVI|nr:response regulator transcription factor [Agrobacterium vitis]KAA3511276.1 DNA-binding response regulator [Agrobacterium vitis]KAA3527901.1 DNA-binding response regulator [Agrobacterium vitis]MCE6076572.1 response regulator [Agrobacterium vitis]MCF1452252.1 response regulator transcription factor [Agrobacterium vitis]MCF1466083.1 response regulator transcription factor [Agrobacterium vitis]
MTRVLLIDDDLEFTGLLCEYLTDEGFDVLATDDGAKGLAFVDSGATDIIVLDVMMPIMNGVDVLQNIRKSSEIPIVMLTARGDDKDRITGLDLGADDYVSKPCSPGELVARLRAILRRTGKTPPEHPSQPLKSGELVLYPTSRQAHINGEALALTGTEYNLLELLVRNGGKVVSKHDISQSVFGRPLTPFDRRIDVHLSSIRQKLGLRKDKQSWIQSVRGQGYILLQDN